MTEEKEVKPKKAQTNPKNPAQPAKNEVQTLDVSAVIKALKAKEWTAEKHRGNPNYLVGVVINQVVPRIIELLD